MQQRFECAMDIGEEMLLCGAEVHRVEESITRICTAFGAVRTDVFIITSSMVVTLHTADGEIYTQTRRITGGATDFEKLHRLNDLSRRICTQNMSVEDIRAQLKAALSGPTYPFWVECICYAVIAGAFTLFFGGGLIESLVSLCVGAIVRPVILLSELIIPNKVFSKFIASLVNTLLATLCVRFGLIESLDMVIIGNIMTLIPGVGLTNALRDLFTGDSIAGLLRTVESVLVALAIAAGYFLVVLLGGAV